MSDESDAAHEWMHSIHTAMLREKTRELVETRREILIKTCHVSTDIKVVQAYGELLRVQAVLALLDKGEL